ncbi:MAG: hypothetical protein DCC68_06745 [Planctomycetota bacterium]|nr:MAG: hypothetical protein DCC68_06745 [Planctomycetota bacterium]
MNEPLVSIALKAYTRIFAPGDELIADFQIDAVAPHEVEAVEASVLWYTEGKGDEDLGVHCFKRFDGVRDPVPLHELRSISTTLPESPLSYDGRIVKIRWCVRVRAFLSRGRYVVADQWFQLGNVPSPRQVFEEESAGDAAAGDRPDEVQRGAKGDVRATKDADARASAAAIF